MALIKCPECSSDISNQAASCTKCGWRPKKSKWWLWVLLGLFGFFLIIIISYALEPEYKKQAMAERDICKRIYFDHAECDKIYYTTITKGELLAKQKADEAKTIKKK